MALSEIDQNLLQRCLSHKPRAWEDFVDRFLGLVIHVVNHSAQSQSIELGEQDREDLAAEVFYAILRDDYGVLRRFHGGSSLATYLTVIARRVVIRELLKRKGGRPLSDGAARHVADTSEPTPEERISNRDEVERLLAELEGDEAEIVKLYHLEGKTYQEISSSTGMPAGSIGPTLTRARAKMRAAGADQLSH